MHADSPSWAALFFRRKIKTPLTVWKGDIVIDLAFADKSDIHPSMKHHLIH
jgi:hypothetical protein